MVTTLDLFTMLIAMTFNGAYFAAVVLGYALGVLLMGHMRGNYERHLQQRAAAAGGGGVFGGMGKDEEEAVKPVVGYGGSSVHDSPASGCHDGYGGARA